MVMIQFSLIIPKNGWISKEEKQVLTPERPRVRSVLLSGVIMIMIIIITILMRHEYNHDNDDET